MPADPPDIAPPEASLPDAATGADLAPDAAPAPFVHIVEPSDGQVVPNPVRFSWEAGNGVSGVAFFADDLPLQNAPLAARVGTHTYEFNGVNVVRRLVAEGYAADGRTVATDSVAFVPSKGFLPPPEGFNRYVVEVINDWTLYPKNGQYPYCWRECPGSMGVVHPVAYLGETLWDGEGSCFCTGHTLEILLLAVRKWQVANGLEETEPLGDLSFESLHGGEFYQHWQGYGVAVDASSATALAVAGIGYPLARDGWGAAQPGDFVNLSRTNGTGHSVIFVSWVRQGGDIAGLRYFGCNSAGDSHPDPEDPACARRVSGPSFVTEMFTDYGGRVIPTLLYVGHVVDPYSGF